MSTGAERKRAWRERQKAQKAGGRLVGGVEFRTGDPGRILHEQASVLKSLRTEIL